MAISTNFEKKGATPNIFNNPTPYGTKPKSSVSNVFNTSKPYGGATSKSPGLLNLGYSGAVGAGKLNYTPPPASTPSPLKVMGGQGNTYGASQSFQAPMSIPQSKQAGTKPSIVPFVLPSKSTPTPTPAPQTRGYIGGGTPASTYNPVNDQITNTQDQLIKATQDKLKSLQDQLKTAQSQGAQSSDQLDDQGNIVKPKPEPTTFPGLVTNLANQGGSPYNQIATSSAQQLQGMAGTNPATSGPAFDAYTQAVENQQKLRSDIAAQYAANESNPIPLEFQQGRAQVMGRQYASQLEAGQAAVNQQQAAINQQISGAQTQQQGLIGAGNIGLTGQSTAQSALGTAAGLVSPTQLPPANVLVSPMTGEQVGGGAIGSLPPQAQTAINSLVDNVGNNRISYQDALSQIQSYGPGAVNALLPAIQAKYPGFNVNQANAQSAAQQANVQQAGEVSALIEKSNAILDTLPAKFDKLGFAQKTGGEIATTLANNISQGVGIGATNTQDYLRTLNEAKATVQAILSSAVNLGVHTGGETADSLLPVNMTREGLERAILTIKDMQEQTRQALAATGNALVSPTGQSGGGFAEDWTQ